MPSTIKSVLVLAALLLLAIAGAFLLRPQAIPPNHVSDTEQARVAEYKKKALAGDHDAQIWMSMHSESIPERINWLEMAANAGHPKAQRNLGVFYSDRTTGNLAKSFEWYSKAARQGEVDSMLEVARCFVSGKGVEKDAIKSLAWVYALIRVSNDKPLLEDAATLRLSLERDLTSSQQQQAQDIAKSLVAK